MKSSLLGALSLLFAASLSHGVLLYENDFESDTAGSPPANVSNISASGGNEVTVLDATTTPTNPLPGQSVLVQDVALDASVRLDIELSDTGENFNNLRIAFDFQRAYAETDDDHRIDFGLGPSGVGLNSQANRTFDFRIRNTGDLVTKGTSTENEPETLGNFDTTNPNSVVILVNTHNENTVAYDYPDTGAGTLSTNSYRVFLNGTDFGERPIFDNADYYTASNVLGKIAFFQDTNSPGGIVFDNIVVETIFDSQVPVINDVVPATSSVVAGDTSTITVGASGAGDLSYQWYIGNSGDTSNPIATPSGTETTVSVGPIDLDTSFWVRVTNADGFTDSDTLTIETHAIRDPFTVNNQSELDALLGTLIPGDTVVIPNGEYADWDIEIDGAGTEQHPVRLVAETAGLVHLTGSSTLLLGGVYVEVEGLVFVGPYTGTEDNVIDFRQANYCRLTHCAMVDYNPTTDFKIFWVNLRGTHNRVDHCYFSGLSVEGLMLVAWLDEEPDYHLIDHNHFANRAYGGGENGWETVRLGTSTFSLSDASITVSDNLFEKCNGEIEIISNKSGDNVFRNNTFFESAGALTLRHGNGCLVDSNIFIGNKSSVDGGPGGVRIIGTDHTVINNYFEGITARHAAVISLEAGIPSPPLAGYQAPHNATIAFNTIVDSSAPALVSNRNLGSGHNVDGVDYTRTEAATNVVVANNLFASSGGLSNFLIGSPDASTMWEGNIAFGASVGGQSGFTAVDPELAFDATTMLIRPATTSPVIDAAVGDYSSLLTLDFDSETREGTYDVGADEVLGVGLTPHTSATTGPAWLPADRVLPTSENTWAGYPMDEEFWVDTGDWLGWIFVEYNEASGVIYILDLDSWAYLTEAKAEENPTGAWTFIYR